MTQVVKAVLSAWVALALVGCSEVRTKSYEGQECRNSRCDQTIADLICISTYKSRGEKPSDVYLCRLPCATQDQCLAPGDVCCGGAALSNRFNASKACVPAEDCRTDPAAVAVTDAGPMSVRDGATVDATPRSDAADGSAGAGDATTQDGI